MEKPLVSPESTAEFRANWLGVAVRPARLKLPLTWVRDAGDDEGISSGETDSIFSGLEYLLDRIWIRPQSLQGSEGSLSESNRLSGE